jgi:hypothetical protein
MDYGTNGNIKIKWNYGTNGNGNLQENARFRKLGAAKNFVGPVGTS